MVLYYFYKNVVCSCPIPGKSEFIYFCALKGLVGLYFLFSPPIVNGFKKHVSNNSVSHLHAETWGSYFLD